MGKIGLDIVEIGDKTRNEIGLDSSIVSNKRKRKTYD